MEAKRATLEEIGLRSEKAVAKHILQENVWESNLIPDIAGVDYFAGHQGRTNLQPWRGCQCLSTISMSTDHYGKTRLYGFAAARLRAPPARRAQLKD